MPVYYFNLAINAIKHFKINLSNTPLRNYRLILLFLRLNSSYMIDTWTTITTVVFLHRRGRKNTLENERKKM